MWDRVAVKRRGKQAFMNNYWPCVGVSFVYTLLIGSGTAVATRTQSTHVTPNEITLTNEQAIVLSTALAGVLLASIIMSILIKIFLTNPVEVGTARFFKANIERSDTRFTTLAEGFNDFGHVFVTLFLRELFVILWTLLLIVPGIMKHYSYRLVPYIVKDEPDLTPTQTLRRSADLMQGNRWKVFVLDLSFLGWLILGAIPFGLGLIFWTYPYIHSTDAALYEELKGF
jgi:uncharacterized membrane protein